MRVVNSHNTRRDQLFFHAMTVAGRVYCLRLVVLLFAFVNLMQRAVAVSICHLLNFRFRLASPTSLGIEKYGEVRIRTCHCTGSPLYKKMFILSRFAIF